MKYLKRTGSLVLALLLAIPFYSSPAFAVHHFNRSSAALAVPAALSNQILVRYKPGYAAAGKASLRAAGLSTRTRLPVIGVDIITAPAGQSPEALVNMLRKDPNVAFAERNGVLRATDSPNDPDFQSGAQYYLEDGTGGISVGKAWDITEGTSSIVVAVCDTGVTLTHPDLAGNLWVNPSVSGNSGLHGTRIEIDWNGDGICTGSDPDLGPEQCAGPTPTDDDAPDFHGTHVSGIIAAVTDNSLNIAGIARHCRIMAVKVLNSDGVGSFDSIAGGIIYAADHGASVINLSLGGSAGPGSDTIAAAVAHAISLNVVVVAAAGNSTNPPCDVNFPASIPDVIAVGATDETDRLASFSCTGPELDLVAPGTNILSTTGPNGTSTLNGTSFSSPMVSGVAALIRSINPALSVKDVTSYINSNTDHLGSADFNTSFGFGKLNAFKAVTAANGGAPLVTKSGLNTTYAYPNPFRPGAGKLLTFQVPESLGSTDIKIDIRTLAGERVHEINGTTNGYLTWDGRNDDGNAVASGLYFYYVTSSKGNVKGKFTVLK